MLTTSVRIQIFLTVCFDRFEIKKKLKTAKKKEKEEKKKKQEEEQEKRKLSQVQDTQVVSSGAILAACSTYCVTESVFVTVVCAPLSRSCHTTKSGDPSVTRNLTKSRRPWRSSKPSARRRKTKQVGVILELFLIALLFRAHRPTLHLLVLQRSFWPNASPSRPARFTLTTRRKRRKTTTSPQSRATGVRAHRRTMMTSRFTSARSQRKPFSL